MDKLVYEDDPSFGPWNSYVSSYFPSFPSLPIAIVIMIVLIILIYSFDWGDWLLFEHPLIIPVIFSPVVILFYLSHPKKYQIFEGKIRVLNYGPFHFDIPFKDIDRAGEGEKPVGSYFGINLITDVDNNIYIIRKTRMSVNITPKNPKLFLENLNKALNDWRRQNPG